VKINVGAAQCAVEGGAALALTGGFMSVPAGATVVCRHELCQEARFTVPADADGIFQQVMRFRAAHLNARCPGARIELEGRTVPAGGVDILDRDLQPTGKKTFTVTFIVEGEVHEKSVTVVAGSTAEVSCDAP
jgi:hypothetical protein